MQNYFNYFTEIEEHFQRRRGTILLLSTLDWALIETWKDAGIPLEAVRRGIDAAFNAYDRRPQKTRKVNSLAYCAQEVLSAAAEMQEAAIGATHSDSRLPKDTGFETERIAGFLLRNADNLSTASLPEGARSVAWDTSTTLKSIAEQVTANEKADLQQLEQHLTVLEEKLQAALLAGMKDSDLLQMRAEADSEIAPYRSKMSAAQISHLHKQYLRKRLLERFQLPRLSLFYMQ